MSAPVQMLVGMSIAFLSAGVSGMLIADSISVGVGLAVASSVFCIGMMAVSLRLWVLLDGGVVS